MLDQELQREDQVLQAIAFTEAGLGWGTEVIGCSRGVKALVENAHDELGQWVHNGQGPVVVGVVQGALALMEGDELGGG